MPKLFVVGCYPPPKKIILILPARQSPGAILYQQQLALPVQRDLRGRVAVDGDKTDRELFQRLPLGDTWADCNMADVFEYLYTNSHCRTDQSKYKFESVYTSYIYHRDWGVNMQDPQRMAGHYGRISKGPSLYATQWLNLLQFAIL